MTFPDVVRHPGHRAGWVLVVMGRAADQRTARRHGYPGERAEVGRCGDALVRIVALPLSSLDGRRDSVGGGWIRQVAHQARGLVGRKRQVGLDDPRVLAGLVVDGPGEAENPAPLPAIGIGDVLTEGVDDPKVGLLDWLPVAEARRQWPVELPVGVAAP